MRSIQWNQSRFSLVIYSDNEGKITERDEHVRACGTCAERKGETHMATIALKRKKKRRGQIGAGVAGERALKREASLDIFN